MRRFLIIFISVISSTFIVSSVFATLSDEELYSNGQNNNYFFDGCSGGGSASVLSGNIKIAGETIEEKIWTGLTSFLTPEQAAGVMGNMAHEGGLNPARHEGSFIGSGIDIETNTTDSYGIGLIQWSFGRRVNVLNDIKAYDPSLMDYMKKPEEYGHIQGAAFLEKAGDEVTNKLLQVEISFLKKEIDASYSDLYNQTTVEDAAEYFLKKVERPANPDQPIRAQDAQKYYDELKDKSISGSGGNSNTYACSGRGNGNLNETAIKLSWDDNTHSPDDPKSDYKTALNKTGVDQLGDDCAKTGKSCDAFVATAVRYSGIDTDFPCCGVSNLLNYLRAHPGKWEEIKNTGKEEDLQPGDIRVVNGEGHIEMYVKLNNGEGRIASASHCDRTADHYGPFYADESAHIFRAKNTSSNTSSKSCTCSSSTGGITEGGMTEDQAKQHMEEYKALDESFWGQANIPRIGAPESDLANCVAYSHYFLARYTTCTSKFLGNGNEIVSSAAATCNIPTGSDPRPYAVFSTTGPTVNGHTGVILGVQGETLIVGEANYGKGMAGIHAYTITLEEMQRWGTVSFAYTDSILNLGGNF